MNKSGACESITTSTPLLMLVHRSSEWSLRRLAWMACTLGALAPALLYGQPTTSVWRTSLPCRDSVSTSRYFKSALLSMPDITGKPWQNARDTLRRLRLTVRARPVVWFGAADMVITQAPPAGTRLAPGDTVVFCWVQRTIPDVTRRAPDVAEQMLFKEGYRTFRRDSVGRPAQVGRVFAQSPRAGTAADSGSVDTIFVGLPAPTVPDVPVVRVPMPPLRGERYANAVATLTTLSQSNKLGLVIERRGVNDQPFSTALALVDSQLPLPGIMLSPQVKVTIMLRDPAPPPAQVRMPRVKGLAYASAADTMTKLSRLLSPPPVVNVRGVNGARFRIARAVVDTQSPAEGSILAPQGKVEIVVRDTTSAPPPGTERMPPLIGISRGAAIDSVTALNKRSALNLRFSERGVNSMPYTNASVVHGQQPQPGDTLSRGDSVQIILGDSARPVPDSARMPSLVGFGYPDAMDTLRKLNLRIAAREVDDKRLDTAKARVLTQVPAAGTRLASRADVSLTFSNRDIPRWWWPLGALSLFTIVAGASTAHVKRARARVDTMHLEAHVDAGMPHFLSANDAFARLGVSIEAAADPGTQRFQLAPTPPARNETANV